jgi:hypothetical protein
MTTRHNQLIRLAEPANRSLNQALAESFNSSAVGGTKRYMFENPGPMSSNKGVAQIFDLWPRFTGLMEAIIGYMFFSPVKHCLQYNIHIGLFYVQGIIQNTTPATAPPTPPYCL